MVPPLAGYGSKKIRAWCNGSIRVSKTFDLGSNPSARAEIGWKGLMVKRFNGSLESMPQPLNVLNVLNDLNL